jgi:hypothetical protein
LHIDGGGSDYHPNTAATVPQRLDNGVNVRRARKRLVRTSASFDRSRADAKNTQRRSVS